MTDWITADVTLGALNLTSLAQFLYGSVLILAPAVVVGLVVVAVVEVYGGGTVTNSAFDKNCSTHRIEPPETDV